MSSQIILSNMKNIVAIVLAAGKSSRFGEDKALAYLKGKRLIEHSLSLIQSSGRIKYGVVVVNKKNRVSLAKIIKKYNKIKAVVLGGKSRFDSVREGVKKAKQIYSKANFFMIHNCANPFAQENEIKDLINYLNKHKNISGVAVGHAESSTLKLVDSGGHVVQTVERENIWAMETPQIVRANNFLIACDFSQKMKKGITDDLMALEMAGYKTAVIKAADKNKKITTKCDADECRYSIGEDSHKLIVGKKLLLGGVTFAGDVSVDADSDGDVILHALCNAIGGGVGMKSLGSYATPMCRAGIKDSHKYLSRVLDKLKSKKIKIDFVSISVVAKKPKIDLVGVKIKKSLSVLLGISSENIGITATTGNGSDFIKCTAIVTLSNA